MLGIRRNHIGLCKFLLIEYKSGLYARQLVLTKNEFCGNETPFMMACKYGFEIICQLILSSCDHVSADIPANLLQEATKTSANSLDGSPSSEFVERSSRRRGSCLSPNNHSPDERVGAANCSSDHSTSSINSSTTGAAAEGAPSEERSPMCSACDLFYARNTEDKTAIMLAAQYNRVAVCRYILVEYENGQYAAELLNHKDIYGNDIKALAVQYGSQGVVSLLREQFGM